MDIQEKDEEDEEEKSLSNDKNDQNVPNDRKIPSSITFNRLFDPFIFGQMSQFQHHSSERTSKNSTVR